MRIKSPALGITILVLIFGGIWVSSLTGYWQTTTTRVPVTYTSGEFSGQYNPADIRGSYTFGEISETFVIPLDDLVQAFGLEARSSPEDVQCKELETLYTDETTGQSVGVDSVRLFVALYKGLPYTMADTDYFLTAAVQILKAKANLTPEQISFLDTHIFQNSTAPTPITTIETTPIATTATSSTATPVSETTHTTVAGTMTGKTTFQELLDWGLSQTDIETAIGGEIPSKSMAVRDYASQKGIEFTPIKDNLQALLDKLK